MTLPLLGRLIQEDFGIEGSGRWWRSQEHSSLVYDLENNIFFYNREGISGDAYIYLTKVRRWNHAEAKEYIKLQGEESSFVSIIRDSQEVITYPPLVEVFYQNLQNQDKSFWTCRTITDETISRFKLGWYDDFYTIPIYQDGLFRQIILRKDQPKKLIRKYYKNVGALLFNSDILRITNKVYFTESPISAIILNQNGLPAVSQDDGASGFQKEWAKYFIHQKEIYLLGDNDIAGINGMIKIAKILGETRCKIYTFEDSGIEHYGADDFFIDKNSAHDLKTLLKEKSKYSFMYTKKGL